MRTYATIISPHSFSSNDTIQTKEKQILTLQEKAASLGRLETEIAGLTSQIDTLKDENFSLSTQLETANATFRDTDTGVSTGAASTVGPESGITKEKSAAGGGISEEKYESLLQQIDFLNSIIGDNANKLQQKDNEIKELERLLFIGDMKNFDKENGEEDPIFDEFGNEISRKAERMYCDICEVFDAHETEDCPIQGDEMPEPQLDLYKKYGNRVDSSAPVEWDDDETYWSVKLTISALTYVNTVCMIDPRIESKSINQAPQNI